MKVKAMLSLLVFVAMTGVGCAAQISAILRQKAGPSQEKAVSSPNVAQNTTSATVISTGDGDTLRVRSQEKPITVRLGCIDLSRSKS